MTLLVRRAPRGFTLRRAPRGFTLLEVLLALGLGLVLLLGAVGAGLALQRRAVLESETMRVQDSLRAASEVLTTDLRRVGAGFGSARLVLGADGTGGERLGYPVEVRPAATFTGGTFGAAPDPYPPSDALFLRTGVTGEVVEVVELADCTAGTGTPRARPTAGTEVCLAQEPSGLEPGTEVLFVHPSRTLTCAHVVTGPPDVNTHGVVVLPTAARGDEVPVDSACHPASGSFWAVAAERPLLLAEEAWGYRVSWRDAEGDGELRPVLQVLRPREADWADLVEGVEWLSVRLGVGDPRAPEELLWFPDEDAGRPALADCTEAACEPAVTQLGGYTVGPRLERTDLPAGAAGRARDALLRRVQEVEVTLVVRSARRDADRVVRGPDGAYVRGPDGELQDGYRRRTSVLRVGPRNFAVAGRGEP